jgi:hypothetical protein
MIPLLVLKQELHITTLHTNGIDFYTGVEGVVVDFSGVQTFEFGTHESRTFSGFHMKEFEDGNQVTVKTETQTILKISSTGHNINLFGRPKIAELRHLAKKEQAIFSP